MGNSELQIITPIAEACGVTMQQVRAEAARSLLRETPEGPRVVVSEGVGPALAACVARLKLGVEVRFMGMTGLDHPVYGPE